MTCQTLVIDEAVVHINYGPEMVEVVNRRDGQVRWCFACRQRREFRYIVMAPAVPDWYGPNTYVKCASCKTSDGDLFPGRDRESDC